MNQKTRCIDGGLRLQKCQKIATTLVVLLGYLLAASCVQAQTGKLSAEKQAKMESTISNFMETSKAPSISAAVVQDGEFVWSAGFGMADLENAVPAKPQSVYRIGSISKSLTATAAMELWEHGKLDLDAPVQKYCPILSAEAVAHHHATTLRTSRRNPLLPRTGDPLLRIPERPRSGQHASLRKWNRRWSEVFCKRSTSGAAWNTL